MYKKNLPYIDLYVGDWIKDCSILSCEAEGAWLRIIMKLHSKGKQSAIKIPSKSLQNLWSVNEDKMNLILKELELNEICEISYHTGFIEFISRRFSKERKLSEIRSKARKEGYGRKKELSKPLQIKNKNLQNTDIDIDIDNDNDIINDIDIDIINDIIPSFSDFWNLYDYKKGKPKAEKLWNKILQKEKELILIYLPDYLRSTPDKKFRKHPATYLSNRSWEDEITETNNNKNETGISKEYQEEILSKLQS